MQCMYVLQEIEELPVHKAVLEVASNIQCSGMLVRSTVVLWGQMCGFLNILP